jgi:hypothetical protein
MECHPVIALRAQRAFMHVITNVADAIEEGVNRCLLVLRQVRRSLHGNNSHNVFGWLLARISARLARERR